MSWNWKPKGREMRIKFSKHKLTIEARAYCTCDLTIKTERNGWIHGTLRKKCC